MLHPDSTAALLFKTLQLKLALQTAHKQLDVSVLSYIMKIDVLVGLWSTEMHVAIHDVSNMVALQKQANPERYRTSAYSGHSLGHL